jgi:predicted peptidase
MNEITRWRCKGVRRIVGGVLMVACCYCLAAGEARAANVSDFLDFSLRSGATTLLPGRLYVPPEATSDPSVPRPLILSLHGAGESGTNNTGQINSNIDNLLAEAKRRGAFMYAPQTNGGWASTTILDRVMTMVDRAIAEQNVDGDRLYVTGLSMGGGGTWNMLHRFGDRFAAGVPICAVSPAAGLPPSNLVDAAIWAFHARNDSVVSFNSSRNVINGILAAAPETLPTYPSLRSTADFHFDSAALDLHYTEYGLGGHGIWGRVFSTPAMYEWMFAHTTAVPEPSALAGMILANLSLVVIVGQRRRRHVPCCVD